MELITYIEYLREESDLNNLFWSNCLGEDIQKYSEPRFGQIWICLMPVFVLFNNEFVFKTMKRPILIIDDCQEHFVKNDNKNFYGLKITSQPDSYQRIKIKNWQNIGLNKVSFIRIEVPLKIEKKQFLYLIGEYGFDETNKILVEITKKLKK